MKHGQGTITYANGNMYEGEFQDDNKFGQGTYTYANLGKNVVGYEDQENISTNKSISSYVYDESSLDLYTSGSTDAETESAEITEEIESDSGQGGYIVSPDGSIVYKETQASTATSSTSNSPNFSGITNFFKGLGIGNSDQITSSNEPLVETEESEPIIVIPSNEGVAQVEDNNNFGTYDYADGDKYIGEVKDGLPHGEGTYLYANGDKYVGQFKDDKRHGQGTYTWSSGDKYVGGYLNDQRHGQGTFTFADGDQYVGEFRNGEFIN